MTTAYTSLLGLALPVTGELSGTWGDTVNNSITSLLDSAVAGTTNVSTDTDVTLTTTTGAANTAREAILLFSGARTALRTVTAPAQSKVYTVINATTGGYAVKLVGAGPTTGVTIVAGESAVCAWNGSDFVKVSNTSGAGTFTNLTVTGNTILGDAAADTLTINATVTSNLIFTDNTYDIGASGATRPRTLYLGTSLISPAITNSGLTSGRVVYSTTGGLETDSANLTFNGTTLTAGGLTTTGTTSTGVLSVTGNATLGDAAADNVTVNGTITSNLIFTDNTYDIGASGATRPRNLYLAGNATIGGSIAATTLDLTNLEVTNIKAKDGTASITIADSTGAVSFANNVTLGDATTDTVTVNGYMGVGGAPAASTALTVASTALTSTQQFGISGQITGSSAATSLVAGVDAYPQTANASFTTTNVAGFYARAGLKGASNTASNWHGVYIADQTQGTNNYGVTSAVSSGATKWNIYASGTAQNYFAGNVGIKVSAPSESLSVACSSTTDNTFNPAIVVGPSGTSSQGGFIGSRTASANQRQGLYIRANQTLTLWGDATGDGDLVLEVVTGASPSASTGANALLQLYSTGSFVTLPATDGHAVFNENGVDADFRVESDTNTHALFVDAGTSYVGVNTSGGVYAPFEVVTIATAGKPTTTNISRTTANWVRVTNPEYSTNTSAGILLRSFPDTDTRQGAGIYATGGSNNAASNLFLFASRDGSGGSATTSTSYAGYYFDGESQSQTFLNAAGNSLFFVSPTAVVVNEDSGDIDFRIESDTTANMFFVDGGNDAVGIGIVPLTTFGNRINLEIGGATVANLSMQSAIAETLYNFYLDGSGSSLYSTNGPAGFISFNNAVSSGWSFQAVTSGTAGASTGAFTDVLALGLNGTVFNESGADIDFRVESDSNTHMLFVDAGSNIVTVALTSPVANCGALQIGAGGGTSSSIGINNSDNATISARYGLVFQADNQDNIGSRFHEFRIGGKGYSDGRVLASFREDECVFNESSRDQDFRVESDASTHMLFVDAGNNRVGINQSTPLASLDVGDSEIRQGGITTAVRTASNSTGAAIFLSQYGDVPVTGWIHAVETGTSKYLILACYKESSAAVVTTTTVASNGLGVQATNNGGTVTLNGFTTGANVKMVAYVIGTTGAD